MIFVSFSKNIGVPLGSININFLLESLFVGLMAGGCGIMGVPWHTAATVRSVAHTSSLSVMSKSHAPGEAPKLLEVKEQRVTNLLGRYTD